MENKNSQAQQIDTTQTTDHNSSTISNVTINNPEILEKENSLYTSSTSEMPA